MYNSAGGRQRPSSPKPRGAILESITLPGEPEQVSRARGFVARVLESAGLPGVDSDAATLLTSELVTNAIVHTDSGRPGGTVTVIVSSLPDGALVEVADNGSAGVPVVQRDPFSGGGQGLFLVQQVATRWGYLRDQAATTAWFRLADEPDGRHDAGADHREVIVAGDVGRHRVHQVAERP
jgi:serine/threonine-protein kinase RsbW